MRCLPTPNRLATDEALVHMCASASRITVSSSNSETAFINELGRTLNGVRFEMSAPSRRFLRLLRVSAFSPDPSDRRPASQRMPVRVAAGVGTLAVQSASTRRMRARNSDESRSINSSPTNIHRRFESTHQPLVRIHQRSKDTHIPRA